MNELLLLAAVVLLACIFGQRLGRKLGIPTLLFFIALGMLFGSDGLLRIEFSDYEFAGHVCSAALIVIMFYGGFGTNWSAAKPVAVRSVLLSTAGVLVTAGLTGLFCHFALGMTMLEGLLAGAVLGSTDAASVFSILRSQRLNLRDGTASMLEIESGSNDPCAYMLTVIVLSLMDGGVTAAASRTRCSRSSPTALWPARPWRSRRAKFCARSASPRARMRSCLSPRRSRRTPCPRSSAETAISARTLRASCSETVSCPAKKRSSISSTRSTA